MNHKTKQDYFSFFTKAEGADMLPYAYFDPHNAYDQLIKNCPDYYLFQDEVTIIKDNINKLKKHLSSIESVIEIGPGSEHAIKNKTLPILKSAINLKNYHAIDHSKYYLEESCNIIKRYASNIRLFSTEFDIMEEKQIKPCLNQHSKCFLFLGSTLGNFNPIQQNYIIKQISNLMNPNDIFILTVDSNTTEESLLSAYNSSYNHKFLNNILEYFAISNPAFKSLISSFELYCSLDKSSNVLESFFIPKEDLSFNSSNYGNINLLKGQKLKGISSYKFDKGQISELLDKNNFELLEVLSNSDKMQIYVCKRV